MTNLLIAIKNIVENPINDLVTQNRSLNRANSMGEALEFYIKDIFSSSLCENDLSKKQKAYAKEFSYLGNQNNPPDIILKGGDAIEVKKHNGVRTSVISFNSSYPKDFLYSDSPMITRACRQCEEWTKKDILYVVGSIVSNKIKNLWFVYGNCYAASREVYEKIKNAITQGVNSLPDIEFGETSEIGRVNKVDPLGITDLRIRGMWSITHPGRVFEYLPEATVDADFKVNALMLASKYYSFPKADIEKLEKLASKNLLISDVRIKSPNNPAKLLKAKLIRYIK
jgi:hypothetical protein